MAVIQVGEGVEATPELLFAVEAKHFLPGERVRALPGKRLSEGSSGDTAAPRAALPQDTDLVVAATWLVRGEGGGARVAYVFEGYPGLHPSDAFADPRSYDALYGVLIHRGNSTWLVPIDDREGSDAEASGPPVRIAEQLGRSARYALGIGTTAEEGDIFIAGLEHSPQLGEFHILENGDGTADLAYVPWWTDASPGEVAICQKVIAEAGFAPYPAWRN